MEQAVKRGRGRPRKHPLLTPEQKLLKKANTVKRPPGRPRKHPLPIAATATSTTILAPKPAPATKRAQRKPREHGLNASVVAAARARVVARAVAASSRNRLKRASQANEKAAAAVAAAAVPSEALPVINDIKLHYPIIIQSSTISSKTTQSVVKKQRVVAAEENLPRGEVQDGIIPTPSFHEIDPPVYPPLNACASQERMRRRSQRISERRESGEEMETAEEFEAEDEEEASSGSSSHGSVSEEEASSFSNDDDEEQPVAKPIPRIPERKTRAFLPPPPLHILLCGKVRARLIKSARAAGMHIIDASELAQGPSPLLPTHVVLGSDGANTATTSTPPDFAILAGLAARAKIVHETWLAEAVTAMSASEPLPKELPHLAYHLPSVRKKRPKPPIFQGPKQVLVRGGGSTSLGLSESQVKQLVVLGGGAVVESMQECEICITAASISSTVRRRAPQHVEYMDVDALCALLLEQQKCVL